MMEIGYKLKQARHEKGLTQEQAAELLAVSRQTVSNWENGKSYPDIISVIRMSDIYSVSLDRLLKEEPPMKQSYRDFLEESTNTVKAKRHLGEIILLAIYLIAWIVTMAVFWYTSGPSVSGLDLAFRGILLPCLLLVLTVTATKNGYWGNGIWFCLPGAAITFLAVPHTELVTEADALAFTFRFPNFPYMLIGILIALCGIGIGTLWKKIANK